MAPRKITIANDLLLPEVIRMLQEGRDVSLRAAGRSMHPYIRDGKDMLVFTHIEPTDIAVGAVVLALTDQDKYVVHRIIRTEGDTVTLKGDGNLYGTERCQRHNIYGLLTAIERDGARIDCNTRLQRIKAAIMRWCYRTPRKIKHRIKQTITTSI